jgi:hypothetical protein
MATRAASAVATAAGGVLKLKLELVAKFSDLRALAWDGDVLYTSRGYELLSSRVDRPRMEWRTVGRYRPEWWRNMTCRNRLSFRLVRDGFHALAILPQGNLVAAVPGAIATLRPGESEFHISHRLERGTRPLHITAAPDGRAFWGEYFDNPQRDEVYIYVSLDQGLTWQVAHTFGKGTIRHVHNILYDRWENCFWIFTGDYGAECRILRASLDFKIVDEVAGGSQQRRSVAAVVDEGGLYFASDTPLEHNYIYHLSRRGRIVKLGEMPSSSIYACRNRGGMFFSTMVEPSEVNPTRSVGLFGSRDGAEWRPSAKWKKDRWSMKLFQYGNALLPDGMNTTDLLAVSTIAVEEADLQTLVWKVQC